MFKNDIAIVTGGSGFVGSHLVDLLIEKNFSVKCIVRKTSDLKWLANKPVEIIDCGLFDYNGLNKVFAGATYIFHVAGVVKAKTKEGYFKGNVTTTKTILEAALNHASTLKKVVIVSSQTAAGPSLNGVIKTETDQPQPITTYGRSKREQEIVAEKFMDKLPITICRAPAVYGERDKEIFIFFKTFAQGLMTTIGFNEKTISLIHVRDLVEGLYLAAVSENSVGEIYFITSEKFYNWDEIGNATSKALNKNPVKVKVPHWLVYTIMTITEFFALFSKSPTIMNREKARDVTQTAWTCSPQKAINQIGFNQKISLEEGIERTVRWYQKEGWLK